jgi:hypothetical protein
MTRRFKDLWPLYAVLLGFAALLVVMIQYVRKDSAEYVRLMNQCLADGRKEYECVGILRRGRSANMPTVMPIVIGR